MIGGVITSTILTLLVIPTVYEILDAVRGRFLRLVGLKPPQTGQHRTYGVGEPVPEHRRLTDESRRAAETTRAARG